MTVRSHGSIQYQLFILALCVYVLAALAVEVIVRPDTETRLLLQYADTAICAVFLLDFALCLYRAQNRWRYLYTWGWVDLASSIPTFGVARWGRAARVARILRVLRGVRATKVLASLALARRTESTFLAAALVAMLMLMGASISILQVETSTESNIRTAEDALWWALSTIATVGYGDHDRRTDGRCPVDVRRRGLVRYVFRISGRMVRDTGDELRASPTRRAGG